MNGRCGNKCGINIVFWQTYLPSLNLKPTSTNKLLFCFIPLDLMVSESSMACNYMYLMIQTAKSVVSIVILEKLGSHFLGERKEFFERFKFNRWNQGSGENIDQYIIVFRTMSKSCGFCDCMKDKLLMESSSPETTRWKILWGVLWQPYIPEKQGAPQSFKGISRPRNFHPWCTCWRGRQRRWCSPFWADTPDSTTPLWWLQTRCSRGPVCCHHNRTDIQTSRWPQNNPAEKV